MSLPLKILWSEGLAVGPQQFQQLDRYHEARLQRIAAALNPHLWGAHAGLCWNVAGLANNLLEAESLSLIFQDGEIYEAPGTDPLPPAVDLSGLPIGEQRFTFYAALPLLNAHGGNLADAAAYQGARYGQCERETRDLFTDAINIDVIYLKKSVRLLSHLESRTGFVSFPVVRLCRSASGGFDIDRTFMPPSVSIIADGPLARMLNSLLGKLTTKLAALYTRHWQTSRGTVEVHGGDLSSFWMLNTISAASASLTHCANYRQHHPENLFDRLMTLAGGLMTFSNKYTLADLPRYDHENAGDGFGKLDSIIRDLVDTVLSSKYFKIPLTLVEQGKTHYHGVLDSATITAQTALYIAVNADMPALELVNAVPRFFRVGSPDDVEKLIAMAMPGVTLVHMAQVPAEVPVRPSTYYFAIENKGSVYETMIKAQKISIHVFDGIPGLKVELFGIAA